MTAKFDALISKLLKESEDAEKAKMGWFPKAKPGEPIYKKGDWTVYKIHSYKQARDLASKKYSGVEAKWDLTHVDSFHTEERGQENFDRHTQEGWQFFIAIGKNSKYAVQFKPGTNMSVYDQEDRPLKFPEFIQKTGIYSEIF